MPSNKISNLPSNYTQAPQRSRPQAPPLQTTQTASKAQISTDKVINTLKWIIIFVYFYIVTTLRLVTSF